MNATTDKQTTVTLVILSILLLATNMTVGVPTAVNASSSEGNDDDDDNDNGSNDNGVSEDEWLGIPWKTTVEECIDAATKLNTGFAGLSLDEKAYILQIMPTCDQGMMTFLVACNTEADLHPVECRVDTEPMYKQYLNIKLSSIGNGDLSIP
jgi:hypothetical protein